MTHLAARHPHRSITRALAVAAVTFALAAAPLVSAQADENDIPGTAGARTLTGAVEAARPAFYEPPVSLPSAPGSVIRSEAANTVADPLKLNDIGFTHRRVMYSTTDREGHTIAATGLVIVPKATWRGPGTRRPLMVHAPGTQGTADRCAASRQFQQFTQYEILYIKDLLMRGYAVAVPDYQGLGTPGSHTYMIRAAQAHAVLDMARAATRMNFPGMNGSSPIGLNGYSQGGGAVAAAAELASTYAPELDIKGVAAGAAPADLGAVGRSIDGGTYAAFSLYATIGMFTAYHVDPAEFLNAEGLATLSRAENNCVLQMRDFADTDTSLLSKNGRRLSDHFTQEPFVSILSDNRIGRLTPTMPVLVTHARNDDVIPYAVGTQLAKDWCARGATVEFRSYPGSVHILGTSSHTRAALRWFDERFAGKTAPTTCGGESIGG